MFHRWKQWSSGERILFLLFVLTLPFIYPRVRVDGIGYYAYARSILIDHNLRFAGDWKDPDSLFFADDSKQPGGLFLVHTYKNGQLTLSATTKSGHLPNHYSIGPAILWSPFIAATHLAVLVLNDLGMHIEPDGFSQPYVASVGIATAFYSFLGVWLSFQIARRYFEERWALLASIGIWFASSLTVYMYADPSWSHGVSAFTVSLFLWYWLDTRGRRTRRRWLTLGLISGLMIDVYFANGVFLIIPFLESLSAYHQAWRLRRSAPGGSLKLLQFHLLAIASGVIALLPTFITRQIVFGSPFNMGIYTGRSWNWTSPAFLGILFSHDRGLLVCTPILIPAILGLFLLWRQEREVGAFFLIAAAAFYCLIAFYPWWDGIVSFGNRFFVSLTPLFILGLSASFSTFARLWGDSRAAARRVVVVVTVLIVWNLGLTYQYATHLFPNSGPMSWGEAVYYEFRVVPRDALESITARLLLRSRTPRADEVD